MVIVTLNCVLLIFIDWICLAENYETHSLYQRAVFRKSIIYLSLNTLFIPAITLTSNDKDQPKALSYNLTLL
jgi:hypothetical protein